MPIGQFGTIAFENALKGVPQQDTTGSAVREAVERVQAQQRQQEQDALKQQNDERDFGFKLDQRRSSISAQVVGLMKSGVSSKDALAVGDPQGLLTPGVTSGLGGIGKTFQEQGAKKELDAQAKTFAEGLDLIAKRIDDADGPEERALLIEKGRRIVSQVLEKNPGFKDHPAARAAGENLKISMEAAPAGARDKTAADATKRSRGITDFKEKARFKDKLKREGKEIGTGGGNRLVKAKRIEDLKAKIRSNILAEQGIQETLGGLISFTKDAEGKPKAASLSKEELDKLNRQVNEQLQDALPQASRELIDRTERRLKKELGRKPTDLELANALVSLGFGP